MRTRTRTRRCAPAALALLLACLPTAGPLDGQADSLDAHAGPLDTQAGSLDPQASGPDSAGGSAIALVERLDSLFPGWLETFRVPGAAVAVVRRDTVLLARGWGVAEVGGSRPVTARTPFRVASLSKPVTATAALRLVEEGAFGLDDDIAGVLGPEDPPRAIGGTVALHHLLTHTAGFDLSDVGDATLDSTRIASLADVVTRDPQPQVLPPGLAHHYSNFGYALIGRMVERATATDFAEYVRQAVFAPLGMERSTFVQPPPASVARDLASGHSSATGVLRPLSLDYSLVAPADALITTASDMAAFLRFHLGSRAGEAASVLSPEMLGRMHATRFTATPSPYGMAYGFEENVLVGRRVLQHAGAQLGFSSFLVLFPEDDLAVFLAQNAREGQLRWALLEVVAEALLEERAGPPIRDPGTPDTALDAAVYAGTYRHTGYTHATFEKSASILGFRGSAARVEPGPEPGTLRINGAVWRHAPGLGPHMFVSPGTEWWVQGFLVGDAGRATHYVAGREVLEWVPWWQRKRPIQLTLIGATLLALLSLTAWPLAAWAAARSRDSADRTGPGGNGPAGERRARRFVRAYSLLWIGALVAFLVGMRVVLEREVQFDYGPTWELWAMLTLLLVAAAGSVALAGVAWWAWRRRWWSVPARLLVSAQAALTLLAVAALHFMNLLGYRF